MNRPLAFARPLASALGTSIRPLAVTTAAVLGRAVIAAAVQALVLLLGVAAVILALLGTLWLSG